MHSNRNVDGSHAKLGFEAKLWMAADKLRHNMDAAEYKHTVLGLIFLKYINDAFEMHFAKLQLGKGRFRNADPQDADRYREENVFWVPPKARWDKLQSKSRHPRIGKLIDDGLAAVERENPKLRGALTKNYARSAIEPQRLGELIDLIGTIDLVDRSPEPSESPKPPQTQLTRDILGRVYEYFLSKFASAEGKKGGQFYTPACIVQTLVAMLAPQKGLVYDPCCGSGGMFVQTDKFVREHASRDDSARRKGAQEGLITVVGQESNPTTRRLAMMNLAIRGIDGDLGEEHADAFRRDLHKDLKADYVIANPPFNDSGWHRDEDDDRWTYGTPPKGNANFAWVQHFIHHIGPGGAAGFVLANGSMSSDSSGEGSIRRQIIEDDLVDCMVALPGNLFYSTQIPVCLWFLSLDKVANTRSTKGNGRKSKVSRKGQTLFIDARNMGTMVDRVHRELLDEDVSRLATAYHNWQQGKGYEDVPGFCKSVTIAEIAAQGYVLTPGRYVGVAERTEVDEPFEARMQRLTGELESQMKEAKKLDKTIRANLSSLGFKM